MSASSRPTFAPSCASATATLAETVLLPTPPLPLPIRITFLTEGTRSLALAAFAADPRTDQLNATSTRASLSGASVDRIASSSRGFQGDAGVGSSTRTRTPLPSRISAPLSIPSSDSGLPDEGSFTSFNAATTCSEVTAMGRGRCVARRAKSRRVQERPPGTFLRALPLLQHDLAVDQHVRNSFRVMLRLVERRGVADGRRIEDDEVGLQTRAQDSAILQADAPCRQRGHSAHCFFERK